MPGALAHAFFALECLDADLNDPLVSGPVSRMAGAHVALVLAGSQGPDPFYFHGMVPWRGRMESPHVHGFADWLHSVMPGDFLSPWLSALESNPDPQRRSMLAAYVYGLVLHYLLDRRVHPYVYSRSGFDEAGGLSGYHGAHHARFETLMDTCLAKARGIDHLALARGTFNTMDLDAAKTISDFHSRAFPDRVGPEYFLQSWADFVTIQRFMDDPHGIRHVLLSLVMGKESRAAALARPASIKRGDRRDFLNKSHASWPDPVTGRLRTESLADLWELASGERIKLRALVLGALDPSDHLPVASRLSSFSKAQAGNMEQCLVDNLEALNHEGLKTGEKMMFSAPCMGK